MFDKKSVEKLVSDGFKKKTPGLYASAIRKKVVGLIKEHEEQLKADPESCVELDINQSDLKRQGLNISLHSFLHKVFVNLPQYEYTVNSVLGCVKIRRKPENIK